MNAWLCLLSFLLLYSPDNSAATNNFNSCTCDWGKVWNDVIFLFDASKATRETGLEEMWGAVQTMLSWFNVQNTSYNATEYNMRIGVIVYASTAKWVARLGEWNGDDVMNTDTLPFFKGDMGNNIREAVGEAMIEFNGPRHRQPSKKVLVIMGTAFNPHDFMSPKQLTDTFTTDGGVVMVYDYIQKDGDPSPELEQFASPGYYFTNLDNSLTDMQNAMCDANCFCLPNFASFSDSHRNVPLSGCYSPSEIPNNYQVATGRCSLYEGGIIATAESSNKTAFLAKEYRKRQQFYIGLSFNSTEDMWQWTDGTYLQQGTYAPWLAGSAPTVNQTQFCVIVTPDEKWVPTDCRNGYNYMCQVTPCDSTRFCQ